LYNHNVQTMLAIKMHIVDINEFRSNLLKYLEMARSGEQISVTSNGKVLATITAPLPEKDSAKKRLKSLSKTAKIHDVLGPIDDCEWEVNQ